MTEKEIIKTLECCSKDDCDNCPNTFGNCYANLAGEALDLINRQKSKIKRLEMDKEQLERDVSNALCNLGELELHYAYARAEAIKEFAGKVKDICRPFPMHDDYECMTIYHQDIDNLVKEMVGDEDGQDT